MRYFRLSMIFGSGSGISDVGSIPDRSALGSGIWKVSVWGTKAADR